jgi:hypothetical protein
MMNMYVMLMIMLWDVNACLTPRGVTATAISSAPSSWTRRRINASQPSSQTLKLAKRSYDVADDDEEDSELYEQLRLEAFHRT